MSPSLVSREALFVKREGLPQEGSLLTTCGNDGVAVWSDYFFSRGMSSGFRLPFHEIRDTRYEIRFFPDR